MLTQQRLLDLGMAADLDSLQRQLVVAAEEMGFGLVLAVLIRGSLQSGRAWVKSIGNTPEAFLAAQHSLDDTLRDPVTTALQRGTAPVMYDQDFYVKAGTADLWDAQAPFEYRCGVACSIHEPSHAECFLLGIDRSAPLPTDPVARMRLKAGLQFLTVHAQGAMQRLLTPAAAGAPILSDEELEVLKWARDGFTVEQIGDRVSVSIGQVLGRQQRAARKLGTSSVQGAVLRCIQGGLIE